ncbi:MAG: hypothetical protein K9J16_16115 [Melioribacteraceae bacterium]|nr:hypothetical protein [Melioribacteraceae bacterium]MCF8353194.1 hypothetical protein [Melioribacteraceae bacterium]MCF8395339.1 hypothetical protein [Melioribacteraceae bacterium]MCF8418772.1 hypothetical protein [Melioribacteraceae bacterium]
MNYRLIYIYLVLIFLVVNLNLVAHGDEHKKEEKHDTVTVVDGDTIAVNGVSVLDSIKTGESKSAVEQTDEVEEESINIGSELFEHLHNKLIHFPIVFILAGLILMLLGYTKESYEPAVKIFVGLAFLFGIASIITGLNQAEPFIDTSKEWIVDIHKIMGIITIGLTAVWEILLFTKTNKKYSLAFAVAASLIVLAVGFLGGIIAH